MKYIQLTGQPTEVKASFDRYFAYLRSEQHRLSAELYDYASRWEHYSIDAKASLHDAWLVTARFAYRERELVLEFLGPWHDRKLTFKYEAIKSYSFDLNIQFVQGDGDVLAHEFRVDGDFITHEIAFPDGRTIIITAKTVIPGVQMIEPTP
jgi:hypothetical protein